MIVPLFLTATTESCETSLTYEEIENELPTNPSEDGTKVLTATTESGETVLSWEDLENDINYSTTEQNTGKKWIDGKTIYQKTIEVNNPVSTGVATSVAHGISNLSEVIDIKCIASMSNTYMPANTFGGSSNYYSSVLVGQTNVQYEMKWGTSEFTKLVVTLYYTKSN